MEKGSVISIDAYAADVVAGRVPAGKYHRLACERHQRDRAREGTPEFPWRFNARRAALFFEFAGLMKHYPNGQILTETADARP